MQKIPVVFTFTESFIVPAYIAVRSLLEHASSDTQYEIIILHFDLTKHHISELRRLVRPSHHVIKIKRLDEKAFQGYPESENWPSVIYVRLFMHDILKKYDKVIYSDVDVLFMGDLSEVYQMDISDYQWAGIKAERNHSNMTGHRYFQNNSNEYVYMSGFMLCNLQKLREEHFSETVKENIKKYGTSLLMFDLDILNMSTEKIATVPFRYAFLTGLYEQEDMRKAYEWRYLRRIYSYNELKNEKKHTVIVHYAGGKGKPWLLLFPQKEYAVYLKKLPPDLKRIYHRCRFKKIFESQIRCRRAR